MIEEPPLLTIRRGFPRPTEAQIDAFRDVPTGFVCDAMDGRGALDGRIRLLGDGRDLPARAVGTALVAENGPAEILATAGALHEVRPGDIVVAATQGHRGSAAAGDQMLGMLKNAGAAGFVTDGEMRDYAGLVAVGLPTWCVGLSPNSPYSNGPGRVGFGASLGGGWIESGDLIVADRDGVVVVPFARIDAVAARLAEVGRLEVELEAKVKAGYRDAPGIAAMIADGRAIIVE